MTKSRCNAYLNFYAKICKLNDTKGAYRAYVTAYVTDEKKIETI